MGRVEGSEREKFNITGQTDRVYLRLNLLTRNLFTILTLLVGGIQTLVGGHSNVSWGKFRRYWHQLHSKF